MIANSKPFARQSLASILDFGTQNTLQSHCHKWHNLDLDKKWNLMMESIIKHERFERVLCELVGTFARMRS